MIGFSANKVLSATSKMFDGKPDNPLDGGLSTLNSASAPSEVAHEKQNRAAHAFNLLKLFRNDIRMSNMSILWREKLPRSMDPDQRLQSGQPLLSMSRKYFALISAFIGIANAQTPGNLIPELHPPLSWQKCIRRDSCTTQAGKIVIDANWRWYHMTISAGMHPDCYSGNQWNMGQFCTHPQQCNAVFRLEGADYSGSYGITTSGSSVTLKFVTNSPNSPYPNIGSRIYLMADDNTYETFNLLAKEFTFDVDVSKVPRGIAADAHFSEMAADGGMAQSEGWNTAGAKYGTGYCDSRCPRNLKFMKGRINTPWRPTGLTTGVGWYGSCCAEMDLWQANSISTAFTAHPCLFEGQFVCLEDTVDCGASSPSGDDRYDGVCDPDGCDYNPYRLGNTSYYGPGSSKTVDSSKKITVVTQFITDDATPDGTLIEIRRLYVQNGVVISNAHFNVVGVPTSFDSITPDYCNHQKAVFGDATSFQNHGGFQSMSGALQRGMVLALSIYDDPEAHLLWLDSSYPAGATGSGVARGTCPTSSGVPSDVEVQHANAYVTFSNIKFGPIGSTY